MKKRRGRSKVSQGKAKYLMLVCFTQGQMYYCSSSLQAASTVPFVILDAEIQAVVR